MSRTTHAVALLVSLFAPPVSPEERIFCDTHRCPEGERLIAAASTTKCPDAICDDEFCCHPDTNAKFCDSHSCAFGYTLLPTPHLTQCIDNSCNDPTCCEALTCFSHDCLTGKLRADAASIVCSGMCDDMTCCAVTCVSHECFAGFQLRADAASIVCSGKGCDDSTCCEALTCSSHECFAGFQLRADAASIVCSGQGCDDTTCCVATCSSHECFAGFQLRADAASIVCSGEGCDDTTCCVATCSSHECFAGLQLRADAASIVCSGEGCDDNTCCIAIPTSIPLTIAPLRNVPTTDAPPTTSPQTAAPPTTVPHTQAPPTNVPQTDAPSTTAPQTAAPLTEIPTLVPPTTVPQTVTPPTNVPQTVAPPTNVPTTDAPATPTPLTAAPPTNSPQTDAPPTNVPQTNVPPTNAPETHAPASPAPLTKAPPTNVPQTVAPPTNVPTTDAPTNIPTTDAPATPTPLTEAPPTSSPQTDAPPTNVPQTNVPQTDVLQTNVPPTNAPETHAPASPAPLTKAPPTNVPQTVAPPTNIPTTDAPATPIPLTTAPPTNVPQTEAPPTNVPDTDAPSTNVPQTASPPTATPLPSCLTHECGAGFQLKAPAPSTVCSGNGCDDATCCRQQCSAFLCDGESVPIPEADSTACESFLCTSDECCYTLCVAYDCSAGLVDIPMKNSTVCGVTQAECNDATCCTALRAFCGDARFLCSEGLVLQVNASITVCGTTVGECTQETCCREKAEVLFCDTHRCPPGHTSRASAAGLPCSALAGGCVDDACCYVPEALVLTNEESLSSMQIQKEGGSVLRVRRVDAGFAVPEGVLGIEVRWVDADGSPGVSMTGEVQCGGKPCVLIQLHTSARASSKGLAATALRNREFLSALGRPGGNLELRVEDEDTRVYSLTEDMTVSLRLDAALFPDALESCVDAGVAGSDDDDDDAANDDDTARPAAVDGGGATGRDMTCACGSCALRLRVAPEATPGLPKTAGERALQQVATLAFVGTAVFVPGLGLGPGTAGALGRVSVISRLCPDEGVVELDATLNPLRLEAGGDEEMRQVNGALVGSTAIQGGLLAISVCSAAYMYRRLALSRSRQRVFDSLVPPGRDHAVPTGLRVQDRTYLMARSRFGWVVVPAMFLYPGAAFCVVYSLLYASAGFQALAAFDAAFLLVGLLAYAVQTSTRCERHQAVRAVEGKPGVAAWVLRGSEEWVTLPGHGNGAWVELHRLVYDGYTRRCRHFLSFELVVNFALGAVNAWSPTKDQCETKAMLSLTVLAVFFGVLVGLRPYLAPYENAAEATIAGVDVVIGVGVLLADRAAEPESHWGAHLAARLGFAVVVLVLAKAALDMTVFVCDERDLWKEVSESERTDEKRGFVRHLLFCGDNIPTDTIDDYALDLGWEAGEGSAAGAAATAETPPQPLRPGPHKVVKVGKHGDNEDEEGDASSGAGVDEGDALPLTPTPPSLPLKEEEAGAAAGRRALMKVSLDGLEDSQQATPSTTPQPQPQPQPQPPPRSSDGVLRSWNVAVS